MPAFASVAAYVVIDTFVLLMWHQILFLRVCRESAHLPQLKALIDYYLSQCQPNALWSMVNRRFFCVPAISFVSYFSDDHWA